MTLFIDTSSPDYMIIALTKGKQLVVSQKIKARQRQGEKLIPALDVLLHKQGLKLSQLKKIEVVHAGESFTSLRIGVVVANALAYALNLPVVAVSENKVIKSSAVKKFGRHSLVVPAYSRPPEIGKKKKMV